ncbi:MAG: 1-deoxy-D-xylulose-5-phosphate synthase [Acidobacteriota bacterium]
MEELQETTLLSRINGPEDVKRLGQDQLSLLAQEVRDTIIRTVAKNGGHLAPNLGVVELTIALHYVFDTSRDRVIWDVGHQAYTHKLLTGRYPNFHTLRQFGGLSGFPKRSESLHDSFGTGHSGTSISGALGMAVAKSLKESARRAIAVIGDGSMTGGIAFEALNHAGDMDKNLIVVLNDNEMSISPNVGALSSFLSRKISNKTIIHLRRDLEGLLKSLPGLGTNIAQLLNRTIDTLITLFTPGMLFRAFDFHYIGPIQGHRLDKLIATFESARQIDGPVLVHVLTQKGKGYQPAESDPTSFHGVGSFDIDTGKSCKLGSKNCAPSYTKIFGDSLVRLARDNSKVVAITAAMLQGTGLEPFSKEFPDRCFDVGIAEQHAVTFAAGLATEGFKPVVAVYSTFVQRAYDQIIHDVCLQNLPVVFAMDRGGLVGEDGPTHHGVYDLSFLRTVPNMVLMAPKDENELQHMMKTAVEHTGPVALRYPRGNGIGVQLDEELRTIEIGKGEVLREGTDILFIPVGTTVHAALEAAERLEHRGISAAVLNPRFIKPLDRELILEWAIKTDRVITIEENALQGGFGSSILEMFQEASFFPGSFKRLGLPDEFIPHGAQSMLRSIYGIDAEGIENAALGLMEKRHGKILHAIGQAAGR